MTNGSRNNKGIGCAVSAAALLAALAGGAVAQEASLAPESDSRAHEVEMIVITGSRIARPLGSELQPTTTIDSEFINNRGFLNVGEAVADIPLFAGTGNADSDFNQNAADVGFTFVDLFGLGTQRTLTLVNGKRVPSSSSPTASRGSSAGLQVDLSSIPSALVERVETISVGGAPTYGADAIAGTVNVILRDSFEGYEFDAQLGMTGEDDGRNYRYRGVHGRNFLDGRLNLVGSVEYAQRDGMLQTDRPGANDIQISHPMLASDPVGFFNSNPPLPMNTFQRDTAMPGVSAYGVPAIDLLGLGAAAVYDPLGGPVGFAQAGGADALVFNENGELIPVTIGDGNGTYLYNQNQPDFPGLYRQQNYTSLLNQSERLIFSVIGRADLGDNLRARLRLNYSDLSARQPIGSPVVLGTPVLPGMAVSLHNPFLSPTARAALQGATIGGMGLPFTAMGDTFTLGRSLNEVSTEGVSADSQNWSATFGLEGEFSLGARLYAWDLTYSRGRSDTDNRSPAVLTDRFALAADVVMVDAAGALITDSALFAAPGGFTYDPSAGAYVNGGAGQSIMCRSRALGLSGDCQPFNPFGANNPEQVIAYIADQSVLTSVIDQQFVQANVSGDLFDLPAGVASFALGVEIREEKAAFSTDTATEAGGFLGQAAGSPPLTGRFTSREIYGETIVPLLDGDMMERFVGARLFDSLQFEGAYRIMNNSEAGTDNAWTAGGRLRFNGSVTLRGNKTRSVRAPAITELFAGQTPLFTGVADPCSNSQINAGPFPDVRRDNCIAAVIAAGLASDQTQAMSFLSAFTGTVGGVPGMIGGNPDLENEVADAWALGLVLTPGFAPGLTVTVDWNDIRIENAISNLGGSQILASCFDSTLFPGSACSQFGRDPGSFNVTSYQAGFLNIGYIDFAALTANIAYRFDLDSLVPGAPGVMALTGTMFNLRRYDTSSDGISLVDQVGVVGREEWRGQLSAGWTVGPLTTIWRTSYTAGAYMSSEERDGLSNVFEFDQTDDTWVHDLSVIYDINDVVTLRVMANNLFEESQPEQLKQFADTTLRLGRTFYLGLSARF